MRKSILPQAPPSPSPIDKEWLDLDYSARVEVTSELPDRPIDDALIEGAGRGWRAAQPGKQTIRLLFDQPQRIRQIHLVFSEGEKERTQEFRLRWLRTGEQAYREILRQQYTFSPPENGEEEENYEVDLAELAALELTIVPDLSGGEGRAQLSRLRLA